eukprot:jgi/Tetstr1/438809/TSEL_027318.t1
MMALKQPKLPDDIRVEKKNLTEEKKHATRDEYRHLLCYGVFTAAAHAALEDAFATLHASNAIPTGTAHANCNDILASALPQLSTANARSEDHLAYYLRRLKCKKTLSGEERVAARLVYIRVFDTAVAERGTNGIAGLLAALDDKRLERTGVGRGGGRATGTKPTKTDRGRKTDKTQPPRPTKPTTPQPDRHGKKTATADEDEA